MIEQILDLVSRLPCPGFFITSEVTREGDSLPLGIEIFIQEKLEQIRQGSAVRKFAYQEKEWRIIFTFFPTDRVVDERYALKNKVALRIRKNIRQ